MSQCPGQRSSVDGRKRSGSTAGSTAPISRLARSPNVIVRASRTARLLARSTSTRNSQVLSEALLLETIEPTQEGEPRFLSDIFWALSATYRRANRTRE